MKRQRQVGIGVASAPSWRETASSARSTLVSSAGLRVLATGGNAVDAAVAAALVATVVMPGRCGIEGDLFAIVAHANASGAAQNGDLLAFHGSGSLPAAPRSSSCANVARNQQAAAA